MLPYAPAFKKPRSEVITDDQYHSAAVALLIVRPPTQFKCA